MHAMRAGHGPFFDPFGASAISYHLVPWFSYQELWFSNATCWVNRGPEGELNLNPIRQPLGTIRNNPKLNPKNAFRQGFVWMILTTLNLRGEGITELGGSNCWTKSFKLSFILHRKLLRLYIISPRCAGAVKKWYLSCCAAPFGSFGSSFGWFQLWFLFAIMSWLAGKITIYSWIKGPSAIGFSSKPCLISKGYFSCPGEAERTHQLRSKSP